MADELTPELREHCRSLLYVRAVSGRDPAHRLI
jgi:hypothetical protein